MHIRLRDLEKSSEFHSIFCPDLSIVTGSKNQDRTLTNELFYPNINDSNSLSSMVITVDNKTLKEKLKTSLARDSIISKKRKACTFIKR